MLSNLSTMDLFDLQNGQPHNLLPFDGEVYYYGNIIPSQTASSYLSRLLNDIDWVNDKANFMGKEIVTKRKVAWYGDLPYEYTYSNVKKVALPWSPLLLELKALAQMESGEVFNSCLLNLYHSGEEGMAWHSDAETTLKRNGTIASLSFGAERKFSFKHKVTKETVSQVLESGSLLIMKGVTQTHWLHRLPPTKKVTQARVNLTFRSIVDHSAY